MRPAQIDAITRAFAVEDHAKRSSMVPHLPGKATDLDAVRAAELAADFDRSGREHIKRTLPNTRKALARLGLTFAYERFTGRALVEGHSMREFAGGLTDEAFLMLRMGVIESNDGFDPGPAMIRDAVMSLCYENVRHAVRKYLDALEWDRVRRVNHWLSRYLGAEDTRYTQGIGMILLTAAVRRARHPGCKFDTMVVLEGPQGSFKSTALNVLAGDEWFSDADLLAESSRDQTLRMQGVWIYEVSELKGLRAQNVETLKAFLSRRNDRTRLPYGRTDEDFPRQCVLVGTTNDAEYLRDESGNRRFLPVRTGRIDIDRLRRDRDQLWAEAAAMEQTKFCRLYLPPGRTELAEAEQRKRMVHDPWADILEGLEGDTCTNDRGEDVERVASTYILSDVLKIAVERCNGAVSQRLAKVMKAQGWEGPKPLKIKGRTLRGYERSIKGNV